MATVLYPLTSQKLEEEARPLKDRIMAWRFFNVHGIDTTTYDGKRVSISGVKFSGSPKQVFWSEFFEPFMVAAATNTFQWLAEQCNSRNLEPTSYFDEAREMIHQLVRTSYQDIACTDQLLRGGGFPNSITPVDVLSSIDHMIERIDALSAAVQHRGPEQVVMATVEDIVELKPNFVGIGVNLNALYRWFRRRFVK